MTWVNLLDYLADLTEDVMHDLILPVAWQKEDLESPKPRAPEIYKMRLPDSRAAKKKAPYIIHQFVTAKDLQEPGNMPEAYATVRSIFCVYHPDEQEGALALLGMMGRFRLALLQQRIIGKQCKLVIKKGDELEILVYPDSVAPYYAGEMMSVWRIPPVERKIPKDVYEKGYSNLRGEPVGKPDDCGGYHGSQD